MSNAALRFRDVVRPWVNRALTLWWKVRVRWGRPAVLSGDARLTVVLLSYLRPQNIAPIVRAALKCEFVSKVVVQNNNPDIDILEWVKIDDPRLRIYNSLTRQGAGARWSVAMSEDAAYYLAIDDDVFLFPSQIARLLERLVEDPSVPHGVHGVRQTSARSGGGSTLTHFARRETNVEVLHQLYFATRKHVRRFHELVSALKARAPEEYAIAQHYGDDIVISHCGESQPRIHDVGLIPMCPTSYAKDVALHQLEEFPRGRLQLLRALRELRSPVDTPALPSVRRKAGALR